MELAEEMKELLTETEKVLKGTRWTFLIRTTHLDKGKSAKIGGMGAPKKADWREKQCTKDFYKR